ncbi:hypothetical protein ACFFRR_010431 [Megaselia abdita]
MKSLIVLAVLFATATCASIPESSIVPNDQVKFNQIEGRIVGGIKASRGEFPYQASISYVRDGYPYHCSGSLISPDFVMTAGHCMYLAQRVVVYLGSNINEAMEPGTLRLEINAYNNSIFIHDRYYDKDTTNDIALIKLPYNVTFTNYIKAVALPKRQIVYPLLHNDMVVASGWGKDSDNGKVTVNLNYVHLPTIKNTVCASYYEPGIVKPTNICASTAGGRGTCQGDSGGPIVSRISNTIVGITSFGTKSCQKGTPVAFTRVHSYLDWIEFKTGIRL